MYVIFISDSEYGLYDLGLCRVQPNSALPEEQKQNIFGTITMWQKVYISYGVLVEHLSIFRIHHNSF